MLFSSVRPFAASVAHWSIGCLRHMGEQALQGCGDMQKVSCLVMIVEEEGVFLREGTVMFVCFHGNEESGKTFFRPGWAKPHNKALKVLFESEQADPKKREANISLPVCQNSNLNHGQVWFWF
jgi:hypothetical protein